MKTHEPPPWNVLRHVLACTTCVLAIVVIGFPAWYWPDHWASVHGALILSCLLSWYVEWRSGMLSLSLPELHAEIRRRGWTSFGFMRPLPLLANALFCVAASVMSTRM